MEAGAALGKIKSRTREKYLDKTPHEEHKGWGAAWRPTVGDSGGGVHKLTQNNVIMIQHLHEGFCIFSKKALFFLWRKNYLP